MEIIHIEEKDLLELSLLYQQLGPNIRHFDKMKEILLCIQSNQAHILLGAKKDGRLVGTLAAIMCNTLFGKCNPFLVVEDVVVNESERRCGIGKALMDRLEEIAKQKNCSYIILLTDIDRPDAQKFYTSLGYKSEPYKGFKKILSDNA